MIAEFYKDCEIFITGGSGAVGKAVIEKLLRSCDVKRIHMLLRDKHDYSVDQRLEKIKQSRIFRVLKAKKPNELEKLHAIPGDAALPHLGLTPFHAKMMENVSIVLHCAATIRFNESLRLAVTLNVGGTWEALKFAETLKHLKIFVHVSTFYSNPYLEHVKPKLYSSPMDWKLLLKIVQDETVEESVLDALTKKIIVGFPNTYCFSKNLAESAVNDYRHRLPVSIYRPSIVVSAMNEPEPGYPPPLVGGMAMFALSGTGLLKAMFMKPDIRLDLTPLDMGTAVMLTTTVLAAEQYKAGKVAEIPIFLFSSFKNFTQTWKEMSNVLIENKIWEKYAFEKSFLLPGYYSTTCPTMYNILVFIYQIIPAMMVDGLLKLCGRKPVLLGIQRRLITSLDVITPFLFNNYTSDGITRLEEIFQITKGTDFSIEEAVKQADTDESIYSSCANMVKKIREIRLHEDESTIKRARKVMKIKQIIYEVVRAVLAYYILRWFYAFMLSYIN